MSVRVKTTWYPISRNHHQSVSSVLEPGKKTTSATAVAIPSTSVSRRRERAFLGGILRAIRLRSPQLDSGRTEA